MMVPSVFSSYSESNRNKYNILNIGLVINKLSVDNLSKIILCRKIIVHMFILNDLTSSINSFIAENFCYSNKGK